MRFRFAPILILIIFFACGGDDEAEVDSFELMGFVRSEGEAAKTRIQNISLNAGINSHFMFRYDNEIDPLIGSIAREDIDKISKDEMNSICEKVRGEIDKFDSKVQSTLGIRSFTERPWLVNQNPTGDDIRRWDAIKIYKEYRDTFRQAERKCKGIAKSK